MTCTVPQDRSEFDIAKQAFYGCCVDCWRVAFVKKLFIVGIVSLLLPVAHADWFDFNAITANDASGFSQDVG